MINIIVITLLIIGTYCVTKFVYRNCNNLGIKNGHAQMYITCMHYCLDYQEKLKSNPAEVFDIKEMVRELGYLYDGSKKFKAREEYK